MHFYDSYHQVEFSHLAIYLTEVCPYVHQKICARIFRTIICYSIKLETTQMSINSRLDKFMLYSYTGILYSKENNLQQQTIIWQTFTCIKYITDKMNQVLEVRIMTTLVGTNSEKKAQGSIPGVLPDYLLLDLGARQFVKTHCTLHLWPVRLPVCDFIFQYKVLEELVLWVLFFLFIELRYPKCSFGYRSKIWKCTIQERSGPVTHHKLALGLKNNCQASRGHL